MSSVWSIATLLEDSMNKEVVGVVGPIASGKSLVAKCLVDAGFEAFSLSDRIRDSLRFEGIEITRPSLQDRGDYLRSEFGEDILARETAELIRQGDSSCIVIESIRHPEEIVYLKESLGVLIVGVNAAPKRRFEFVQQRGRTGDSQTWEEFLEADERENDSSIKDHRIRVSDCLDMADVVIENDGSKDELKEKICGELEKRGLLQFS